ncbi:MAG: competence type IV pilus ATPase ComGA [Limosilactobacillus sp.]|uniref:competence type IV pilus ATPase ComGA n=1 Tax=Limosilactobacillus sp. TaxID=2773925 RepID=UPI0027057725|nr:competence type IV pilus ATPase ComGA [Limosilactobacillus sp.]
MKSFEKEIAVAIGRRAADLYILPYQNYYRLLMTCVGKLEVIKKVSPDYGQRLISFLKYQADMAVSEHRRPQLGAMEWQHGSEIINLRLSSVGDYQGRESLVVRFIYHLSDANYQLLAPDQWNTLTNLLKQRGLILFAGPMGSGKTTTMYQLARTLAEKQVVMTIEDPVEINEPSFVQLQVNERAGMDYQQLLRLGLRHRPDVFIIGEIRDPETAKMTVRAALSGHLVLGTVHAKNANGVIARLEQLGVTPSFLQQTLTGIFYQRLLPTTDGKQAILFDDVIASDLDKALTDQGERGMTDGWRTKLEEAATAGLITDAVKEEFYQG